MREVWEIERSKHDAEVARLQILWAIVMQRWQRDYKRDFAELRKPDGRRIRLGHHTGSI